MKTRRDFLNLIPLFTLGSWSLRADGEGAVSSEPLSLHGLETLFLTWSGDPTTTMRFQWISFGLQNPLGSTLFYRIREGEAWQKAISKSHPFGLTNYLVNRVDLSDLISGTIYQFKVGDSPEIGRFQTAPEKLNESVVFAEGGDIGTDPVTVTPLHQRAASWEPLFGLVGGDLAYSNATDVMAELRYLKLWNAHMRGKGNRLIPMIAGIGNHEVQGGFQKTKSEAPFFYALFDGLFLGQGAYGTLDFGNYLSLILLDSRHTCEIEVQSEWLRESLVKRRAVLHRFVFYHVPAYPSVRNFDDETSLLIRKHWLPILEQARVRVVFEHHDHAFKRTKKLLGGKENEEGITFLGDGAWGRAPRSIRGKTEGDGIFKSSSSLHVWKVVLSDKKEEFIAENEKGIELDRFVLE